MQIVTRRHGYRQCRPGFSLVEALVVIVIIGIISTMAMPGITKSLTNTKVDRAAQVVVWDIQAAFSYANRQHKPVQIVLDPTNLRYVIRDRATSTVFQRRELGGANSPYGVTTLGGSSTTITIFPNGLAGSAFNISLVVAGSKRRVTVTRTGLIRVIVT